MLCIYFVDFDNKENIHQSNLALFCGERFDFDIGFNEYKKI
jgi:hypothetical protein